MKLKNWEVVNIGGFTNFYMSLYPDKRIGITQVLLPSVSTSYYVGFGIDIFAGKMYKTPEEAEEDLIKYLKNQLNSIQIALEYKSDLIMNLSDEEIKMMYDEETYDIDRFYSKYKNIFINSKSGTFDNDDVKKLFNCYIDSIRSRLFYLFNDLILNIFNYKYHHCGLDSNEKIKLYWTIYYDYRHIIDIIDNYRLLFDDNIINLEDIINESCSDQEIKSKCADIFNKELYMSNNYYDFISNIMNQNNF